MEKLELFGEVPETRFGHTVTQISKTKVLLYGGATGSNGKFAITSETYLLDLFTRKWRKLDPQGVSPNERAAHASVAIDSMKLVLYGGATGGGGLASEDLFLLDLCVGEDKAMWGIFPTSGNPPGRRYGHTMAFLKPFLVVFGGVPGNDPTNDVFTLNIDKEPFIWNRIEDFPERPPARVYHSASVCQSGKTKGMMLIFGGRSIDQVALNDIWGLRRHRNGKWDWVRPTYKSDEKIPLARFQHNSLFMNSFFLIIGGRSQLISDVVPIDIFDVESQAWFNIPGISRFRQANWIFENQLYTHGGLDQSSPNIPINEVVRMNLKGFFQDSSIYTEPDNSPRESNLIKYGPGFSYYNTVINPWIKSPLTKKNSIDSSNIVKLSRKAYVASSYQPYVPEENTKIRKISIIKLQEESKKIGYTNSLTSIKTLNSKNNEEIADFFIDQLLIDSFTSSMKFSFDKLYLAKLLNEVEKLIQKEPTLLRLKSPIKIFGNLHGQLGDLLSLFYNYGTPSDSVLQGDIDGFSYLFLGDYIDKGFFGLETLVLLFAFKLKHPDSFFLLRGHHEDRFLNRVFGFGEECAMKLEEDIDETDSFFQRINRLFEYLPLAALIDGDIFCVHGGIGTTLLKIEEIEKLERPIEIAHIPSSAYDRIVAEMLLSDPVLNESESQTQPNSNRDYHQKGLIMRFTAERVRHFLKENRLRLIIRSHECVIDGFEDFSSLITIYSAMDYCEKNAACVLVIRKNSKIVKKVLFPDDKKKPEGKWRDFSESDSGITFNETELKIRGKNPTPPRRKAKCLKNI